MGQIRNGTGTAFVVDFNSCPSLTPYPSFTVTNVNLTGGPANVTSAVNITAVQDAGSTVLGGSFSLSVSGVAWTPQIPTNATNAQITTALLSLPEISDVKVTRDVAVATLTGLTVYVAVNLPVVNLPPLMVNSTLLTGPGLAVYVHTVLESQYTSSHSPRMRKYASKLLLFPVFFRAVLELDNGSSTDMFFNAIPGDWF